MLEHLLHSQMQLGLAQAGVVAVAAMVVAYFAARRGAKGVREIPLVLLRGLIQILAVGFIIVALMRGPWWTSVPVLTIMVFIAATIVRRRVPQLPGAYRLSLLCTLAGAGGVLTVMTLLGVVEPTIIILIPVGSMVIAQNMNIQSLFLDRFLGEVQSHRGEIESALSLGATAESAVSPYLRASFQASLIPATDNLRSLGIVWIPGMMAGMVLSGTSPAYAALYQFVILGMIFTAGAVSSLTATYLAPRRIFTEHEQLRALE